MTYTITISILLATLLNFSSAFAAKIQGDPFKLEEELLLLGEEFVITATKTKKKMAEAPAIVTVITAQEIKNMGARTWIDVLETVPGFGFTRGHHDNNRLEVRGIMNQKSNKIRVMIDGHSLNEPFSGSAFHFTFHEMPVHYIKRIEIIRGPGSALYGENAFLAVINIITKKAADIDGLLLEVGGGTFDTRKYDALFGKESGDFKVSVYADYYESDGADLKIKKDSWGLSGETFNWIERFFANFNASYNELNLNYFIMDRKGGADISPNYMATDNSYFEITQMFAELKYEHQFANKLTIKPRVYVDLFDWLFHNKISPDGVKVMGNVFPDGLQERRDTQNITWGGELELHYSLFDGNDLLGGYQYEYSSYRDTIHHTNFDPMTRMPLPGGFQDISDEANFIDPDFQEHLWAVYLQDEWAITDDIFLTGGGRYDYYDNFDAEFSPRFSLVWSPLDKLHVKLLYGEAFRIPDTLEQSSRNNLVSLGNPDIEPEKIKTYEIGLRYAPLKYFQGEINLFYDEIEDMIVFAARTTSTAPRLYINSGEIKSAGFEVAVKSEHSQDTYITANYSYADPEDEDGRDVPDIAKHKFNVVLSTYIFKYLNGSTTLLFRGSRERAEGDPRNELPSHYLVNLHLLAHNFLSTMEVSATIHNLFDKDYADPAPVKLYYDLPREGRSYMAYLRYKF